MSLLSGYIAGGATEMVDVVVEEGKGPEAADDEVVIGEAEADW